MASASVGAIELDYRRQGEGPPLLMIMGMSGTYDHWDMRFLELLARERELILYDHRGVGRSSRAEAPFTIAELAADALGLLEALDLPSVDVLGFSMGGMVAQELALAAPQRLRSLVLASTSAGGARSAHTAPEVLERLGGAMSSGDRQRALRAAWEVNTAKPYSDDADAYERFCAIGAERRVAMAVVLLQMRAIAEHDACERLAALRTPTLVLHGTQDMMVPPANASALADAMPGAQLQLMEGAGHLFFWEAPERAAELVLEHLHSNSDRRLAAAEASRSH
ncbi:MAG TPA: alpha/beta fold hydrolase [Solirubrobacteraceae bacterium]|nr:alpha/beta fold hydrolase [Solirubrobacteraceae bacterium]